VDRLISIKDINLDIFESYTTKLIAKELLYLKNICNMNFTSVLCLDLYKEDIYIHYAVRSPSQYAIVQQNEILLRKERRQLNKDKRNQRIRQQNIANIMYK
jgi:hypothetical protein